LLTLDLSSLLQTSADAFLDRPDSMFVFEAILEILPEWISTILTSVPSARFGRLRSYMKTARTVAKEVVERQTAAYLDGKEGSKDIMSILGNADTWCRSITLLFAIQCVPTWRKILSNN
jgi:hypothetical protein